MIYLNNFGFVLIILFKNNNNVIMETKFLKFDDQECIDIVRAGHVLALPTETVFGLGIIYDSLDAFNELNTLKQRTPDKPYTIMVSKKEEISQFVDVNDKMQRLIDVFMPGEITIIFPAKEGLFPWLTLNKKTVGIRIAALKEVPDLIKRVGKPMLVTSANISNHSPLLDDISVYNQFNGKIHGIVRGTCTSKIPSTIVLIDGDELKLIRQGSIPFETIYKEWIK